MVAQTFGLQNLFTAFMNSAVPIFGLMIAFTLSARGDTFVLKDGSRLNGSILREDDTSYVIEVNVTKSIKDERVVAKEDVITVEKEQKDLIAFEAIARLTPTPDALTAADYAARILRVEKFLNEFGDSPKAQAAKEILVTLKTEADEISAGGIKFGGKIITAAEYRTNALDIDAGIQEARIRALLREGQYLAALRTFSVFDRNFRNTKAHGALLPLMVQTINSYLTHVAQSLAAYEILIKEREIGLQRMQLEDRRRTQAAIAEEIAQLEVQLKAEKDGKLGWVSTHPLYKPSLDETITFGRQELTRLTSSSNTAATDAGAAFREALRKIQNSKDAKVKTEAIAAAKTANVTGRYLTILETAATQH